MSYSSLQNRKRGSSDDEKKLPVKKQKRTTTCGCCGQTGSTKVTCSCNEKRSIGSANTHVCLRLSLSKHPDYDRKTFLEAYRQEMESTLSKDRVMTEYFIRNSIIPIFDPTTLNMTWQFQDSKNKTIILPFRITGNYNCTIDWGDDSTTELSWGYDSTTELSYPDAKVSNDMKESMFLSAITHAYSDEYLGLNQNESKDVTRKRISISVRENRGNLVINPVGFANETRTNNNHHNLIDISQWGCTILANRPRQFNGCTNLNISAKDAPRLVDTMYPVTTMRGIFDGCTNFNSDISHWDTSEVTDMSYMFNNAKNFDKPLTGPDSKFNTSKVTNMRAMFQLAIKFNKHLTGRYSKFNTSQVTDMSYMFQEAHSFNKPLTGPDSKFNTSQVTDMSCMFYDAKKFDKPLIDNNGNFNTSNVTNMRLMFAGATNFNQSLIGPNSTFNTSKVTDMAGMFQLCINFDKPLLGPESKFNTSQVTDMSYMFGGATKFNQPIATRLNKFDTSQVTDMAYMFVRATSFDNGFKTGFVPDRDRVFKLNTNRVTDMSNMFEGATSFRGILSLFTGPGFRDIVFHSANNDQRLAALR